MIVSSTLSNEINQYLNNCQRKIKFNNVKKNNILDISVEISDDARENQKTGILNAENIKQYSLFISFSEEDIKEVPEKYFVENLFKFSLKVSESGGYTNIFEEKPENQYKVFVDYLHNNGFNIDTDSIQDVIKSITRPMDNLNSLTGFRGTSIESIVYLQGSVSALENIKDTLVPDELRDGFGKLIEKYEYFNLKSRENISRRMIPDFAVISDKNGNVSYRYKEEIISSEQKVYNQERAYFSQQFCDMKNNISNKDKVDNVLNDISNHLRDFYKKYKYINENDLLNEKVNNIMSNLNEIWRG